MSEREPEQFDEDSESEDDEDYVPIDDNSESEESVDEQLLSSENHDVNLSNKKLGKAKVKNLGGSFRRTRRKEIQFEEDCSLKKSSKHDAEMDEKETSQKENEKQKADVLWSDFLNDVNQHTKSGSQKLCYGEQSSSTVPKADKMTNNTNLVNTSKVVITKEYDFAGELVSITKEVEASSEEAKQFLGKEEKSGENSNLQIKSTQALPKSVKRLGVTSVLGQLSKKPKMTALEKSKLDWSTFKEKEGISEELNQFIKSKDGYLDRQAFLQRVDHRQFEIEKTMRLGSHGNR
ncbi:yeti [Tachypleus tridentatus]|uniref:yeti n=1 Tax=Tachypleus tridentatus TaxID=6853 RepID=UPI003FD19AD3